MHGMFSRFISVIHAAQQRCCCCGCCCCFSVRTFSLILPRRLLPFTISHSLSDSSIMIFKIELAGAYMIFTSSSSRWIFDMVCAPYTLNNLYLSFEFVVCVCFVRIFSGALSSNISVLYYMCESRWKLENQTTTIHRDIARCDRERKNAKEENDCEQ